MLDNIHHKRNLIALCDLCHNAFDNDEWTFLPKEGRSWVNQMVAEPEKDLIRELNQKEDVVYCRILLQPGPDMPAFQDESYRSAFENQPEKSWPGEAGVLILRNGPLVTMPLDTLQKKAIEARNTCVELANLWMNYSTPCSKENCPICGREKDKGGEDDSRSYEEEGRGKDGGEDEEESENEEEMDKAMDDTKTNRNHGGSKRQKSSHQKLRHSGHKPSALKVRHTKRLVRVRHRPYSKTSKPQRRPSIHRQNYSSIPYDESVPYSHRVGYTLFGTTSNDLMRWWQATH